MLRVVALVFLVVPRCGDALVHTLRAADDAVTDCRCECCLTEMQRDDDATQADAWSRLQCAFDAAAAETGGEAKCSSLCRRSRNDTVIATAQAEEMDTQRFCFFECEPKARHGPGRAAHGAAQPGDGCKALTKSEANAVHDRIGDARDPMETPQVMSHFLVAKTETAAATKLQSLAASQALSAAPTVAEGPWKSVLSGAAMEQGAAIAVDAGVAAKNAEAAVAALKKISETADVAGGNLMNAMTKAQDARKAAEAAAKAEARIREIKDGLLRRAKKSAEEELPGIMKKMRAAAEAKAKTEAWATAAATQAKWTTDGMDAKAEAMKGYEVAMARAASTANEYVSQGNGFAAQSLTMQTNAQTAQQQANQFQQMGDVGQAQKMLLESKRLMKAALGLNSQASKYYDTAANIQKTLPAYGEQATAAGYHAELIANPDAPPPGMPLVLAQTRAEGRKLRARAGA